MKTKKSKFISVLLSLAMVVSLIPMTTISASATEITSSSTTWNDGDTIGTSGVTLDGTSSAITITLKGDVTASGPITIKGNVTIKAASGLTAVPTITFDSSVNSYNPPFKLNGGQNNTFTLNGISVKVVNDSTAIIYADQTRTNNAGNTVSITGGTFTTTESKARDGDQLIDYAKSGDSITLAGCTLKNMRGLLWTKSDDSFATPSVTISDTVKLYDSVVVASGYTDDLTISAGSGLGTNAMFDVESNSKVNGASETSNLIIKNTDTGGSIFSGTGSLTIGDYSAIVGASRSTKLVSPTVSSLSGLTLNGCTLQGLAVQGNTEDSVSLTDVTVGATVAAKNVLFNRLNLVRDNSNTSDELVNIQKSGDSDDTTPSSALLNVKAGYTTNGSGTETADQSTVQIKIADGALVYLGGPYTKIANLNIESGDKIFAATSTTASLTYGKDITLGSMNSGGQHAEVAVSTTSDDNYVYIVSKSETSNWNNSVGDYTGIFTSVDDGYEIGKWTIGKVTGAQLEKVVTSVTVSSWAEISDAFANAPTDGTEYTITLGYNISSTYGSSAETSLTVPAGANIVLDLEGYTLSGEYLQPAGGPTIKVSGNGALTINDSSDDGTGKIVGNTDSTTAVGSDSNGTSSNVTAIYVESGSTKTSLTINGGSIYDGVNSSRNPASAGGNSSTVYLDGACQVRTTSFSMTDGKICGKLHANDTIGSVSVSGGTITNGIESDRGTTVQISGGTIGGTLGTNDSGTYSLTGGTYTDYTKDTLPGSYIASGYEANNDTYNQAVVSKVSKDRYTEVTDEESLKNAISNGNSPIKITLKNDITLTSSLNIPSGRDVTIDLNGHSLDANGAFCPVVDVYGTLNLEDSSGNNSGKITGASDGGIFVGGGVQVHENATFNMSGGTITGNKGGHGGGVLVSGNGATMNMSGGKITGNSPVYHTGVYSLYGGTINVSGGEITGNEGGQSGVDFNVVSASASLTGGTYGNDVSAYVADGYKCISNSDGTYSVVPVSVSDSDTGTDSEDGKEYTLILDFNGGTTSATSVKVESETAELTLGEEGTTATATFTGGASVSLPAASTMSKDNATFLGWYNESGNGPYTGFTGFSKNRTYTAKWAEGDQDVSTTTGDSTKEYTLTLNTGGGTISASGYTANNDNTVYTSTFNGGSKVSLPTPVRDGCVFKGWYRTSDGKGSFSSFSGWYCNKSYTAKWSVIDDGDQTDDDSTTTEVYKLTLDLDGGTTTANYVKSFAGGATVTLPAADTMSKDGYTFAGWYNNADFTGDSYEQFKNYYQDVTYYAKWDAQEAATDADKGNGNSSTYYTLTLVTGDGGVVTGDYAQTNTDGTYTTSFQGGASTDLPTPTKAGYIFRGWYNESGKGAYSGFTGFYKNRTYTAKWAEISSGSTTDGTFTVTLDTDGGTLSGTLPAADNEDGSYKSDTTVTLPDATKAGYTFKGWTITKIGDTAQTSTDLVGAVTGYNDEITLQAQYAEGDVNVDKVGDKTNTTISITLDLNGGTYSEETVGLYEKQDDETYKTTVTGGATYLLPGDDETTGTGTLTPTRSGYTFAGWYNENGDGPFTSGSGWYADKTYTAKWTTKTSGSGSGSGSGTTTTNPGLTVGTSSDGTITVSPTDPESGDTVTLTVTPNDGYTLDTLNVTDANGNNITLTKTGDNTYTFTMPDTATTISATWKKTGNSGNDNDVADPDDTGVSKVLETEEHDSYLNGYSDGTFKPNANMTRAEVAQMFYNLLKDKSTTATASFSDVSSGRWYATAVNTLASLGIIEGTPDGKFEPNRSITRAEFTTIAMRFTSAEASGTNQFSDVKSTNWYYSDVVGATSYGWIDGYSDGTFKPGNAITRAEVATIVNRMLAREADETYIGSNTSSLKTFSDVKSGSWYYYDVCEATNSHDYSATDGDETWSAVK